MFFVFISPLLRLSNWIGQLIDKKRKMEENNIPNTNTEIKKVSHLPGGYRKHGLQLPYNFYQILSWIIYFCDNIIVPLFYFPFITQYYLRVNAKKCLFN